MPNHFKVHELLDAATLEALEAYAREPGRTIDEVLAWLTGPERSYNISRGAVGNWMQMFREQLMRERFGRSGELARAIKTAVAGGDFGDVAEATSAQLIQVVFEQTTRLQSEGEVDPDAVESMTRSLKNLIGGKRALEQYKGDVKSALAAAATDAAGGASGAAVVDKVRQILGLS